MILVPRSLDELVCLLQNLKAPFTLSNSAGDRSTALAKLEQNGHRGHSVTSMLVQLGPKN